MGIKFNKSTGTYDVSYSKRHPILKRSFDLKKKGVKTQAESKRIYAELIVRVNDKIKRTITPQWGNFLEEYYLHLQTEDLSQNTKYCREKVLGKYTSQWNLKCIDEITQHDIHQVLNVVMIDNADSHRKFFLKCVRSVFEFAMSKNLVQRNPTPLIKFKINDKIKAVLSKDQIMTLLTKAKDMEWEWYPHYAVAIFTGMRSGELYALAWEKVDLDKRQIKVDVSWNARDGFKSTKSGDDRVVEIPRPLLPVLFELKLQSAESHFVLPRLRKWDQGEQARELRMFLQLVGLPKMRFHDLRASWATLLLAEGVKPVKVMAMGGWKDMDTMMIYIRKAGIDIKNSTDVLDHMSFDVEPGAKILEFSR